MSFYVTQNKSINFDFVDFFQDVITGYRRT